MQVRLDREDGVRCRIPDITCRNEINTETAAITRMAHYLKQLRHVGRQVFFLFFRFCKEALALSLELSPPSTVDEPKSMWMTLNMQWIRTNQSSSRNLVETIGRLHVHGIHLPPVACRNSVEGVHIAHFKKEDIKKKPWLQVWKMLLPLAYMVVIFHSLIQRLRVLFASSATNRITSFCFCSPPSSRIQSRLAWVTAFLVLGEGSGIIALLFEM